MQRRGFLLRIYNEKLRSTSGSKQRRSLELLQHIIFDCTYLLPVNVNVCCSKDFIEATVVSDWAALHTQRQRRTIYCGAYSMCLYVSACIYLCLFSQKSVE
jgi:hypothetical protein